MYSIKNNSEGNKNDNHSDSFGKMYSILLFSAYDDSRLHSTRNP